jgi:hypothetical protein
MVLRIDFSKDRALKTIGATRAFPVGTPEGDTLRSTIPTTYTPPPDKPATPPTSEPPKQG